MAANHTTRESLAESPLNSAVSDGEIFAEFEEKLTEVMIMIQEIINPTELQNNFVEMGSDFSSELATAFSNPDITSGLSVCDELTADSHHWSQNITDAMHFSATDLDSYSSIFDAVGSPLSVNIVEGSDNQAKGGTSGSLFEQSDVADKAARRRISNRESARISRTKKQAQLLDLEKLVKILKTENATQLKQLSDSWHQLYNANANNLILKSNVEALRAKVRLAEEKIRRINNQLDQNQSQLNTATQINNINRVGVMANVWSTNTGQENDASYAAKAQISSDVGSIWKPKYCCQ